MKSNGFQEAYEPCNKVMDRIYTTVDSSCPGMMFWQLLEMCIHTSALVGSFNHQLKVLTLSKYHKQNHRLKNNDDNDGGVLKNTINFT